MLWLTATRRERILELLVRSVSDYAEDVDALPVAPRLDPAALRTLLAPLRFEGTVEPEQALEMAVDGLRRHQVHTPHRRYFGLFNPAPTTLGVVADTLVACFNPQLAAWSHSPFAAEVERHVVRLLAGRFGYAEDACDGTFTTGGAEANHTALLVALERAFPSWRDRGVRAFDAEPVLYVSAEAHHSFLKAARLSGLGTAAVREIATDQTLRLSPEALEAAIEEDRAAARRPFLVVGTAGTTNAGAIDPIPKLAEMAQRHALWLHVDAAWGGAAVLAPELRGLLSGIERADSITFDAHKWLSVPMGAGVWLTRHPGVMERTFGVETGYMPRDAEGLDVQDPYARTIQWSRRFIGLKVFLSLLGAGWDGYAAEVRRMAGLGDRLRERLTRAGWVVLNRTSLPVVCFADANAQPGRSAAYLDAVCRHVVGSGSAWISTTRLGGSTPALRACITNFRTREDDLDALVDALEQARSAVA